MKRTLFITALLSGLFLGLQAQVTIGSNDQPNSDALLDMKNKTDGSADKGLLLPRVALSATTSASPLSQHVKGMAVYNTANVGDVTAGYYYNDGTKWVRLADVTSIPSAWLVGGNTNGALKTIGTNDAYDLPVTVNSNEAMRAIWDGTNNVTRVAVGTPTAATVASSSSGSEAARQQAAFTVAGGDAYINGLTIGTGGGSLDDFSDNMAIGVQALYNNTHGIYNYASGNYTLFSNTTGSGNYASGLRALYSNTTGSDNYASGHYALYSNTTGQGNHAIGENALYSNTTGNSNYASGSNALYSNTTANYNYASGILALRLNTTGSYNYASGFAALYNNTTGSNNMGLGCQALYSNTTGTANHASGYQALYSNTTGSGNHASGYQALYNNTTGAGNHASGFSALYSNTTGQGNHASGENALHSNTTGNINYASGSNALYSNTTANYNYASGILALRLNTTGSYNYASGFAALYNNTTGSNNMGLGYQSLYSNTTGGSNIGIGYQTLLFNVVGNNNVAIGTSALQKSKSESNVAVGSSAAFNTTTGGYNVTVGVNSLYTNTIGQNNTTLGFDAGYSSTGSNNTLLGFSAGQNISSGANNTTLGYQAGYNITTGSKNIAIGASVTDMANNTASNQLNIGNAIFGTGMTGTVAAPAGKIGIGTNAPSTTLHVQNSTSPAFRLVDGTQAAGNILTSDANGNASWQPTAKLGLNTYTGTFTTGYTNIPITTSAAASDAVNGNTTYFYCGLSITLPPGKYFVQGKFGFFVQTGVFYSWRYVAWSTAGTATIARSTVINDGTAGSNQSEFFVGGEYVNPYPYNADIVVNNSWVIDLTAATGNTTIYFYQRDQWGYKSSTITTQTACCQDQYSILAFKMQ